MRLSRGISLMALLVVTTASGCATMNVGAFEQPGTDFGQYHSFASGPADALPTGDPRLDNNPFFHDYLQGAVIRHLARRGIDLVDPAAQPDLLLHYHASVTQRFAAVADRPRGSCPGGCEPQIVAYDQGTLVLDIVDPVTNTLIWRGWSKDALSGLIDSQTRMQRQIEQAVTRMLAHLPVQR
jgi:hypothetical protein